MGKFKVWVGDDGIIRGKIIGEHTGEDARRIIVEIDDFLDKDKGKKCILIDMIETGRPTAECRKIHATNIKNEHSKFNKTAFFGAKVINRVMANFIIKASGKGKKVRYFDTEKEALKWLNE
jgi:hypothetical protein